MLLLCQGSLRYLTIHGLYSTIFLCDCVQNRQTSNSGMQLSGLQGQCYWCRLSRGSLPYTPYLLKQLESTSGSSAVSDTAFYPNWFRFHMPSLEPLGKGLHNAGQDNIWLNTHCSLVLALESYQMLPGVICCSHNNKSDITKANLSHHQPNKRKWSTVDFKSLTKEKGCLAPTRIKLISHSPHIS